MMNITPRKSPAICGVQRRDDALYLQSERGVLRLSPQTGSILRVSYTEREAFTGKTGFGICRNEAFGNWSYEETETELTLQLPELTVVVCKATGTLCYYDRTGTLLLREKERSVEEFDSFRSVIDENTKIKEVQTPDGIKRVITEATKVFDKTLYHTRLELQFQKDEKLFGLGQAEEGSLNLRGTTQYLHQANMKIAIPFLLSSKGYGLLLATGSPAVFSDTAYGSYLYTEADEEMDFYFISGKRMDEIIGGYRLLTGKAAMLPKWGFGFLQSQERYESQEELLRTQQEFAKREIGLDGLILDWQSWPGNGWGQKTLDPERFPEPTSMMEELHKNNTRLMISIWPNMTEGTPDYEEFKAQDLLLPASEIYDAFRKEARSLYWKQTTESLFSHGIDAWWCDSSEPFTPEWSHLQKPETANMYAEFVREASKYIPSERCNAYGLAHSQTLYEGQRGENTGKRVTNLTRNGYTGSQKYGVILWSGDTAASWDCFQKQIVAGLNFCATGLPYWTLDIGGFFVKRGVQWFWNGDYEKGLEDLGYRELFVRWFQYGAFLPVFRSHGTDVRREPWHFGAPGEPFYDALLAANRLRYRLIPYLYSLAGMVWLKDSTMMRMLAFDFPEDPIAMETKDQFMLGSAFLVCPVTEPMYYGVDSQEIHGKQKTRTVYLPEGTDWYDFYTDEKYAGGLSITVAADISRMPLFVKAGSILPMTEPLMNTAEESDAPLTFHVYSGKDTAFTLYEDQGDGYGYENGDYRLTELTWSEKDRQLTVPKAFPRQYEVQIHGSK